MENLKKDMISYFTEIYPETNEEDILTFVENKVSFEVNKKIENHRLIITVKPTWNANDELIFLNKRI